ncbi:hydroxyacid-oxoacid transhydrogenase [Sulfolobus tengchongensis]|uniref:hydroxyacid-oxoacid transhydrogenase n=1 Tax=Sulfolobus tengchongensis TaxID=207809 RepID=A0AAX4L4E9_9CREN
MSSNYIAYTPNTDSVFVIEVPRIKFGIGASEEVGFEAKRLGLKRVMLVVGKRVSQTKLAEKIIQKLEEASISVKILDDVRVEPDDEALIEAYKKIKDENVDGFIALGGGSTIDTAKVLDLIHTYPAELSDYINAPIGKGNIPPGPTKPLIAIPTTAGTGSESTAVAVLDVKSLKVKTGISNPYIRPAVAIVDPLTTITLPPMVTASTGLDVLNHAIESFTSRPYTSRQPPESPLKRAVYAGSTPVGDIFASKAIEWVNKYLRRAVANPTDIEARYYMMLGASIAGIGFGHAGVHLPHAMAYPIAGMVEKWHPPDYDFGYAIVPHGISTAIPAAYAFRYLAKFYPERFKEVLNIMGIETSNDPKEISETISEYYLHLLEDISVPTKLRDIGFSESHLDKLVEGTLAQRRLLEQSPKRLSREEIRKIFMEAL